MRDLFYMELRDRCEEIRQQEHMGIVSGKGEELAEFVRYVVWLSEMTRSNGLLILEEEVEQANIGVAGEASVRRYFFHMLQLIVDGADSQEIEQICMAEYFSAGMRGYDALQYLVYFAAAHAIQTGVHHRVIEEELVAMLPEPCRSAYERIRKEPYVAPKEKTGPQCEEHIYLGEMLSQEEINRLLSECGKPVNKPDPSEIQARREEIIKSHNERMRSTTKAERMAALESFCGFYRRKEKD